MKVKVKVTQSCPTLWDPMDYTVHGILQARIVERVDFPFSRGSSQPRDRTQVSSIAGGFFTTWATREAQTLEALKPLPLNWGSSSPLGTWLRDVLACSRMPIRWTVESPRISYPYYPNGLEQLYQLLTTVQYNSVLLKSVKSEFKKYVIFKETHKSVFWKSCWRQKRSLK